MACILDRSRQAPEAAALLFSILYYLYFTAAIIARIASGFVSARVAIILRSTIMFFSCHIDESLNSFRPSVRRNALRRTVQSLRACHSSLFFLCGECVTPSVFYCHLSTHLCFRSAEIYILCCTQYLATLHCYCITFYLCHTF